MKCQHCQKEKRDAYHRPDLGQILCADCNLLILRKNTPTGLFRRLRTKAREL